MRSAYPADLDRTTLCQIRLTLMNICSLARAIYGKRQRIAIYEPVCQFSLEDYAVPARKTQELASLLSLVNDDSARAIAIIREIMYYSPNR